MNNKIVDKTIEDITNNLYKSSKSGKKIKNLIPLILSDQNIFKSYINLLEMENSKLLGFDNKNIDDLKKIPIEDLFKIVREKLKYYKPKKAKYLNTQNIVIPNIWDRLIQQCIFQIIEPICEAKFHEKSSGWRPYRSEENTIAQCYKMAQLQDLTFVIDLKIKNISNDINNNKLIRQLWAIGIQDKKLLMIIKEMLKANILFKDLLVKEGENNPHGSNLSLLLINVTLNELDWWIAKQWEMFSIKEGTSGFVFYKYDKNNNIISIDRSQRWKKLREKTNLKEVYIVRYGYNFKLFCKNYTTAFRVMKATKQWLFENLHLNTDEGKIVNLRKNYISFLGIKFKLTKKNKKWVIKSKVDDIHKKILIIKLRKIWKEISKPYPSMKKIHANINLFNSIVINAHKYYSMATLVSRDFAEINYKVVGKISNPNYNNRSINVSRNGSLENDFIRKKYKKSKQLRWIEGRAIIPISYVSHKFPRYKKRFQNKYE